MNRMAIAPSRASDFNHLTVPSGKQIFALPLGEGAVGFRERGLGS